MLLEEIVGKVKPTETPPTVHPKEKAVEIELHDASTPREFDTGSGTIISSDGWILTAKHLFDGYSLENSCQKIIVKTQNNQTYALSMILPSDDHDLALAKLANYTSKPFNLHYKEPNQQEPIQLYSYMQGSMLVRKGKVYFPTIIAENCYGDELPLISVKIPASSGQSGSLITTPNGSIVGLLSAGLEKFPSRSGKNTYADGPRSVDIQKFLRKVYRSHLI